MTGIAAILAHPTDPLTVVVRPPYDPKGEIMNGFAAATYSPSRSGYLLDAALIPSLERWLTRQNIRIVDERQTKTTTSRLNPGARTHDCAGDGCRFHTSTLDEWAARHPDEAQPFLDWLDDQRRLSHERKIAHAKGGPDRDRDTRNPARTGAP